MDADTQILRLSAFLCGLISTQEIVELFADDPIALAGSRFQALAIEDSYLAMAVGNQASLVQLAGDLRDAGPAHAQHLCQEFMGQRELV